MLVNGSTAIPAMSRWVEILHRKRIYDKDNDNASTYIVRQKPYYKVAGSCGHERRRVEFYLCEEQGAYPILSYLELDDIDLTKKHFKLTPSPPPGTTPE